MKYWKEHVGLRLGLIFAFFVAGMVLLIVGLILLLSALMIYNKPFEGTKKRL